MNIFILIWVALSLFLLGFWFWSNWVLFKQKQVWKLFAQKRKLRYYGGKMFDSPEVAGTYQDFEVLAFTAEHDTGDGRVGRRLTSIEVTLHSSLPTSGAVASGGMVKLVEDLHFQAEFRPDVPGWDNSYIVRSRDNAVMKAYLTERRVEALVKLMKIKNAWIILFFTGGRGLLRIDMPDPLYDPRQIDQLMKQMVEAARVMELEKGETSRLTALVGRDIERGGERTPASVIEAPRQVFEEPIGLSLEDD